MKRMEKMAHGALSLVLAAQLAWPSGVWALDVQSRDLQVGGMTTMREKTVLWVLSIGVSHYADPRINLKYADNDAVQIARMMATQQGSLFREVFTRVLVNEQATREEILKSMSEFLGQASREDVVLIFLAGHGLQDRQTGTYYFVPHNANTENLVYAGLPMPMFEEAIKRLRTNVEKMVLWLDTCHAGAMTVAARGVNTGEDLSEALAKASGQYVLSASNAGEESLEAETFRFEGSKEAHGAFTYSVLRGLQGAAADSDGVVWLSDLFGHVSREVPRLTQGRQHPHGQLQGTNMPLFVTTAGGQTHQAMLPQPSSIPVMGMPSRSRGSKKWLWLLLGTAAVGGGAAVGLSGAGGGGGGGSQTPIEPPPDHP